MGFAFSLVWARVERAISFTWVFLFKWETERKGFIATFIARDLILVDSRGFSWSSWSSFVRVTVKDLIHWTILVDLLVDAL